MKICKLLIGILLIVAFLVTGCASGGPKGSMGRPKWYGKPDTDVYLFSYAFAQGSNQMTAYDLADSRVRSEATLRVKSYVETRLHGFVGGIGVEDQEVTASVSRVATALGNSTFEGSFINEQEVVGMGNGEYMAYVQLAIPKAQILKQAEDRIKRETTLLNLFRDSQATEAMQKEIRELEARERAARGN